MDDIDVELNGCQIGIIQGKAALTISKDQLSELVVKAPMAAVAPVPEAVVLEPALNQLAEVVSQVPVPPSPAVEPLTSQKRLAARAAGGATASMAAAANSDARLIRGRGF